MRRAAMKLVTQDVALTPEMSDAIFELAALITVKAGDITKLVIEPDGIKIQVKEIMLSSEISGAVGELVKLLDVDAGDIIKLTVEPSGITIITTFEEK